MSGKERLKIVELGTRIEQCKREKAKLESYLQDLKDELLNNEIDRVHYDELVSTKISGRTIPEWLSYYDDYIKKCQDRIDFYKIEDRKSRVFNVAFSSIGLVFAFFLILGALFYLTAEPRPLFAPPIEYIDDVGISFSESGEYVWKPSNLEKLQSLKISGSIEGEGNVLIFINDLLILDSKNIEPILLSPPGNETGNETNSTQPDPPVAPPPENESENNETNITEPTPPTAPPLEIETEKNDTNITQPSPPDVPPIEEPPIKDFSNYCDETCDLSELNGFNLEEYEIKILIVGEETVLNFDSITYEILGEEIEEEPEIEKVEEKIKSGKKVRISKIGNKKDVTINSEIPESWNIRSKSKLEIQWKEKGVSVEFEVFDTNDNGILDLVEWQVPDSETGEETFEIIVITNAEHLDQNREFISDIFREVVKLDDIWSETIPSEDFVRVTFEIPLDSTKDITLYPRAISGIPRIEVYEINGNDLIAEFDSLNDNEYNTVLLTNLVGEQDTFDLRIVGGSLEFDHIIDPVAEPGGVIELRAQTCEEQNQQSNQNTFGGACDGTYPSSCPGDRLSCNDGVSETATASKSGSSTTYGGVKINNYNTAITDCISITNVNLCYKFWGLNKHHACTVGVDNDGDNTFVDRSAPECLSNTAPGVTCIDVTSDEAWVCSNFFGASGTRASAKAQALRIGGNGVQTWNFDTLFFRVTYDTNQPPTIVSIDPIPNVDLAAGTTTDVTFQFTAEDLDGASDLDDSTATATFSKVGEATRIDPSCSFISESLPNQRTYECTVTMQYFDGSGTWDVAVSVEDMAMEVATDTSTFDVNLLQDISLSGTPIDFGVVIPGTQSNAPAFTVTNNGNYEGTIKITANDLAGPETLFATNFFAAESNVIDICTNGNQLQHLTLVEILSTNLLKDTFPGEGINEDVIVCLDVPTLTLPGDYSATGPNAWEIGLSLAGFTIKRKKKKKKRKLVIKDEKLVRALNLMTDELKEKYKLSEKEIIKLLGLGEGDSIPIGIFSKKLGGLEALCKYMKENLGISYHEIAEEIKRDDRTVWTAYKKAKEKSKEKIKVEKDSIMIPMEIFKDGKLTVLEAVIVYLRERRMKYGEIAKLMGRDQRNVQTIYSRAKKKQKQYTK